MIEVVRRQWIDGAGRVVAEIEYDARCTRDERDALVAAFDALRGPVEAVRDSESAEVTCDRAVDAALLAALPKRRFRMRKEAV
jgi:hypothetical protein